MSLEVAIVQIFGPHALNVQVYFSLSLYVPKGVEQFWFCSLSDKRLVMFVNGKNRLVAQNSCEEVVSLLETKAKF